MQHLFIFKPKTRLQTWAIENAQLVQEGQAVGEIDLEEQQFRGHKLVNKAKERDIVIEVTTVENETNEPYEQNRPVKSLERHAEERPVQQEPVTHKSRTVIKAQIYHHLTVVAVQYC